MTRPPIVTTAEGDSAATGFDEAFLLQVDRAVLARKRSDPCRLDQVHRALEEQVHLASVHDPMYLDRPPRREPS
jgi:hypothetical protein